MRCVAALIAILAAVLPATADEARLRELIAQLDAEDPGAREKAAAELAAAGEHAWPLLEEAARAGSPEVRQRAEALLTPLKIRRVLDRPSLRALAPTADPATAALARDRAFEDWIVSGVPDVAAVEGLLEILRAQPNGWAFEALDWIAAPARMGALQGGSIWSTNEGVEPESAQNELQNALLILTEEAYVEWSEEATERLRGVMLPARDSRPCLDTFREVWAAARVVVILDAEADPRIVSETQALAAWEEWWEAVKASPVQRRALGLDPAEPDLAANLARLDSRDPHEAAAAARACRAPTPALRAAVEEAASRPGARPALVGLRERLRLAGTGRVLFSTGRKEETRVWSVGLDGGGRRLLSGDLAVDTSFGFAVPGGSALFVSATPPGGKEGVWKLDLAGAAPPEREPVERGGYLPSPDGARALLTHSACSVEGVLADFGRWIGCGCKDGRSGLALFDRATGTRAVLLEAELGSAWWSPDSAWIAWTETGRATLSFRDVRGARAPWQIPGPPVVAILPWSPDGDRVALVFPEGADEPPQLRILDVARREVVRKLDLPAEAVPGVPVWSADGATVAIPWSAGKGKGFEIAFLEPATGAITTRTYPIRSRGPNPWRPGRWTQDRGAFCLSTTMEGGSLRCPVGGGDPVETGLSLERLLWIPGSDLGLKASGPDILAAGLGGEFFRIPTGVANVKDLIGIVPGP